MENPFRIGKDSDPEKSLPDPDTSLQPVLLIVSMQPSHPHLSTPVDNPTNLHERNFYIKSSG
jgi:hypothetical protein